jgi:nucleotide-binding universal stress UspA family protein
MIIVGVDQSEAAKAASRWGAEEARIRNDELTLIHVWQPLDFVFPASALSVPPIDYHDDLEQNAQQVMEAALLELGDAAAGLDVRTRVIEGSVAGSLLEAAEGAELLVVGSHGRGAVLGALLGSVSQQCAHHTPCPLAIVRSDGQKETPAAGNVVVGVDASENSEAALHWALGEAERRSAHVLALHAWSFPAAANIGYLPTESVEMIRDAATTAVDDIVRRASGRYPGVKCEQVVTNGPAAQVLVEAAHGASLLVVGTRGRGGFTSLLLGSTSQQCAHHAPCPIVIVPSTR